MLVILLFKQPISFQNISTMTTVITTPMGNIGQHVVSALLKTEESLRVIVRNPHKLAKDIQSRVEVVQGSIDQYSGQN